MPGILLIMAIISGGYAWAWAQKDRISSNDLTFFVTLLKTDQYCAPKSNLPVRLETFMKCLDQFGAG
jgi:hypothetical protein